MKQLQWIFGSLLIIGLIGSFIGCGENEAIAAEKEPLKIKQVSTSPVESVEYGEVVFATGKLSTKEELKLSFKTGGLIKRVYVREGQTVGAGTLLAELDLEEIRAQAQQADLGIDQAALTVSNAEIGLERIERDFKNVQGLFQDSVATLEQMEDVELALRNAKNQLEAARKGLAFAEQNKEVADFNLKYSKIVAPTRGTILKKLAEGSELVGPGTPILLFGTQDQAKVVKVFVADKEVVHLGLGDPATLSFDAYPGTKFSGKVSEVASFADPYTGTYEVEISLDAAPQKLLSGFIASVEIAGQESQDLLKIPVDALLVANGSEGTVYVHENGKALRKSIQIYKLAQDHILVAGGIQAGEEVIVRGAGYLSDQEPVLVQK